MTFLHICARAYQIYRQKSLAKHPTWDELSDADQRTAITGEYNEWLDAYYRCDVHGEHGEIAELLDLIVTAVRRIMELMK